MSQPGRDPVTGSATLRTASCTAGSTRYRDCSCSRSAGAITARRTTPVAVALFPSTGTDTRTARSKTVTTTVPWRRFLCRPRNWHIAASVGLRGNRRRTSCSKPLQHSGCLAMTYRDAECSVLYAQWNRRVTYHRYWQQNLVLPMRWLQYFLIFSFRQMYKQLNRSTEHVNKTGGMAPASSWRNKNSVRNHKRSSLCTSVNQLKITAWFSSASTVVHLRCERKGITSAGLIPMFLVNAGGGYVLFHFVLSLAFDKIRKLNVNSRNTGVNLYWTG
jgi:hypothetical protein